MNSTGGGYLIDNNQKKLFEELHSNDKLSLQLPPIDNSPPLVDNFIAFYLKSQLKNKKLELNPKMYKDYKN